MTCVTAGTTVLTNNLAGLYLGRFKGGVILRRRMNEFLPLATKIKESYFTAICGIRLLMSYHYRSKCLPVIAADAISLNESQPHIIYYTTNGATPVTDNSRRKSNRIKCQIYQHKKIR